jgi:hypothetical protein
MHSHNYRVPDPFRDQVRTRFLATYSIMCYGGGIRT